MTSTQNIFIAKESIKNVVFHNEDVLQDEDTRLLRQKNAQRALTLGNLFKTPVNIEFISGKGEVFRTEATVWAVTSNHVVLKDHTTIPIRRILHIEF